MSSLEHLGIDRNSVKKEYFSQDTLDMWTEMASENEDFKERIQWILDNKQQEADGRLFYISTLNIW